MTTISSNDSVFALSGGQRYGLLHQPIAFVLLQGWVPELKLDRARTSDTDFAGECTNITLLPTACVLGEFYKQRVRLG